MGIRSHLLSILFYQKLTFYPGLPYIQAGLHPILTDERFVRWHSGSAGRVQGDGAEGQAGGGQGGRSDGHARHENVQRTH